MLCAAFSRSRLSWGFTRSSMRSSLVLRALVTGSASKVIQNTYGIFTYNSLFRDRGLVKAKGENGGKGPSRRWLPSGIGLAKTSPVARWALADRPSFAKALEGKQDARQDGGQVPQGLRCGDHPSPTRDDSAFLPDTILGVPQNEISIVIRDDRHLYGNKEPFFVRLAERALEPDTPPTVPARGSAFIPSASRLLSEVLREAFRLLEAIEEGIYALASLSFAKSPRAERDY